MSSPVQPQERAQTSGTATARMFDRPVFIMGAPRSCSTLLFQTLAKNAQLCSLGNESHRIFEGHPKLSPGRGFVDSNRVTAELYDEKLASSIKSLLAAQLQDHQGRPLGHDAQQPVRMLEKTPKHALRIPFIDALFPDALFIYLFRDPRDNISSIIDAWRSGSFVTYRRFQTAHGPWSLLLPPGWRDMVDKPLEEIAAFQWHAANRYIIDDLGRLAPDRWTAINAAELLESPGPAVARLCQFMGTAMDGGLQAALEQPLPLSRFTISPPDKDKWRRNAPQLARVWPRVNALVPEINRFIAGKAQPLLTRGAIAVDDAPATRDAIKVDDTLPAKDAAARSASHESLGERTARNQPCPCGSGLRYKQCHGRLS